MATITEGGFLYLQHKGASTGISTEQWGIMVTDMPHLTAVETKSTGVRDWPDANGEDVYNAANVRLAAFDFEIGLIYLGTMAGFQTAFDNLLSYLTTGTLHTVYSAHTRQGKKNCYLKSMSGTTYDETGDASQPYMVRWTLKMRCADPTSSVTASKSGSVVTLS